MEKTFYLAITIGPIYKTMIKARKTRELWSVSFSFSLLMNCIIQEFRQYGEVLSPADNVTFPLHGAGVYPDRCFIKLNNKLDADTINQSKMRVLKAYAVNTGYDFNTLDYFQIYTVQKELYVNPIQQLNQILDGLELSSKYFNQTKLDFNQFWSNAGFFQNLYQLGYGNDQILPLIEVQRPNKPVEKYKRFPSIPEIATRELEKKDPFVYWNSLGIQYIRTHNGEINYKQLAEAEENEDEIISKLKSVFGEQFMFRHKYFTIIQADGDNVGKLIRELEAQNGDILEFSRAMNEFVAEAAHELVRFGAFPVYLGGDDLFFFAPLTYEGYESSSLDFLNNFSGIEDENYRLSGDNIFFSLSTINEIFRRKLSPLVQKYMPTKQVSLSYGVSAGYYKKPMNEIFEESYDLLFYNAKQQPSKNYIAMRLEKHSGQTFEFGFAQNSRSYYYFLLMSKESKQRDENFLNSVMFKIEEQQKLVYEIAHDKSKLANFFKENFNEAGHLGYQEFFKSVVHFIFETYNEFINESNEEKMQRVFGAMRFVQFLIAKDQHE